MVRLKKFLVSVFKHFFSGESNKRAKKSYQKRNMNAGKNAKQLRYFKYKKISR